MRLVTMDLVHGLRTKYYNHCKLNLNSHFLLIKLSTTWFLKVVARTVLFALALASFPSILTILDDNFNFSSPVSCSNSSIESSIVPLLFRDLSNEGLLKPGNRVLFVARGGDEEISYDYVDLIFESDTQRQSSIPDETYDLAITHGFRGAVSEFIDRTLKLGGIIITVQHGEDINELASNYKISYVRHFEYSTLIAMNKTSYKISPSRRRLLSNVVSADEKRAALRKLEDVLLEPPRSSSRKLKTNFQKTRYLPDIIDDSLESYPRRVFVDVENDESEIGWFEENYPRKNKNFEVYRIKTVSPEEVSSKDAAPDMGLSDWLKKNVRKEEYVVMKAEAGVVEEMVKNGDVGLVDELFMECKHQGLGGKWRKSSRAYWECLALYGRLRDEGVAVHQWWG